MSPFSTSFEVGLHLSLWFTDLENSLISFYPEGVNNQKTKTKQNQDKNKNNNHSLLIVINFEVCKSNKSIVTTECILLNTFGNIFSVHSSMMVYKGYQGGLHLKLIQHHSSRRTIQSYLAGAFNMISILLSVTMFCTSHATCCYLCHASGCRQQLKRCSHYYLNHASWVTMMTRQPRYAKKRFNCFVTMYSWAKTSATKPAMCLHRAVHHVIKSTYN